VLIEWANVCEAVYGALQRKSRAFGDFEDFK
jgi:hypothetical protein